MMRNYGIVPESTVVGITLINGLLNCKIMDLDCFKFKPTLN